jgi:hypothetical protein
MNNVQLRIRIGNAHNGADGEYANATIPEAIEALTGDARYVYVVGCWVEGFEETVGYGARKRTIVRKVDEPVFGLEVTVNPPRDDYSIKPAEVNWSALGASDVDTTLFYAQLLSMAANLATAANFVTQPRA